MIPGTKTIIEASLCNITDTCYWYAYNRFSNALSLHNKLCFHCTDECSNVSFTVTTSSVAAPTSYYANMTKMFVESRSNPLPTDWSTNWPSEVQNNYNSLEVVSESTHIENYTQEASISSVDVLSRVGGHTGLWLGISSLSVVEFIEMVYRLPRYEYHVIRTVIRTKFRNNMA